MHIDQPAVRNKIRHIVQHVVYASDLHDDFTQEACIYFWQTQAAYPGRTLSWYCQAIRFHLQHLLHRGRSVDSPKRRNLIFSIESSAGTELLHPLAVDEMCPHRHVSVGDLLRELCSRLDQVGRQVLLLLVDGHGVREVASLTGISPAMVIKHRGRIAEVARRLEIDA